MSTNEAKEREAFEAWFAGMDTGTPRAQVAKTVAWLGYQQGIADEKARKVEMTAPEILDLWSTLNSAVAAIAAYEAKAKFSLQSSTDPAVTECAATWEYQKHGKAVKLVQTFATGAAAFAMNDLLEHAFAMGEHQGKHDLARALKILLDEERLL